MRRSYKEFVALNVREIYHELGTYDFKIVLDAKRAAPRVEHDIRIFDSSGMPLRSHVRRWGTKVSCSFVIDERVSDGVARIDVVSFDGTSEKLVGRLSFWVIKP